MDSYDNGASTNFSHEKLSRIIRREGSYVHFFPAVRLGDALASREDYQNKSWAEIEPEARRQWEAQHERPWEEFKEIVQQAWAEVKDQFQNESGAEKDPNSYETRFLDHYRNNNAHSTYHYDHYAPAYYYGYDLAVDRRLQDKNWAEIELEAARYWNSESYAGPWEEFKEAVFYAWNEVRQAEAVKNPALS